MIVSWYVRLQVWWLCCFTFTYGLAPHWFLKKRADFLFLNTGKAEKLNSMSFRALALRDNSDALKHSLEMKNQRLLGVKRADDVENILLASIRGADPASSSGDDQTQSQACVERGPGDAEPQPLRPGTRAKDVQALASKQSSMNKKTQTREGDAPMQVAAVKEVCGGHEASPSFNRRDDTLDLLGEFGQVPDEGLDEGEDVMEASGLWGDGSARSWEQLGRSARELEPLLEELGDHDRDLRLTGQLSGTAVQASQVLASGMPALLAMEEASAAERAASAEFKLRVEEDVLRSGGAVALKALKVKQLRDFLSERGLPIKDSTGKFFAKKILRDFVSNYLKA
jgi:hypothetical protein